MRESTSADRTRSLSRAVRVVVINHRFLGDELIAAQVAAAVLGIPYGRPVIWLHPVPTP